MKSSRLLKSYRARAGYPLRALTGKLSCTYHTYNRYELNPNCLPLDVLLELIDLFELSDDDITNFLHALKIDNSAINDDVSKEVE